MELTGEQELSERVDFRVTPFERDLLRKLENEKGPNGRARGLASVLREGMLLLLKRKGMVA